MNDKLRDVYRRARAGQRVTHTYINYCNTRISATVAAEFGVEITRHDYRHGRTRVFDVRNLPLNAFLDRLAEWLVTGEVDSPDSPADPLEW